MAQTNNVSSSSSGGISFIGALQIAFIVLKLTNVIDWGWFYVMLPMIISVGIALLFGLFALIMLIVALILGTK